MQSFPKSRPSPEGRLLHIFAEMSRVILDRSAQDLYYLMVKGNGISEISIFHPAPAGETERTLMDFFEQVAREQVRAMILNHARREDLSQVFSQGEMRLLGCLNAGADGRTAGELSTLLDLSTARIAAMLNNLERKGAITRARDTADRRRVVVRLTEQGRNEVQTSFNEAVACLSEVYRRMGEADTRELLRLSDRAGEIAQQIYEEQKEDTPCGC